jgi:hypothetical protein
MKSRSKSAIAGGGRPPDAPPSAAPAGPLAEDERRRVQELARLERGERARYDLLYVLWWVVTGFLLSWCCTKAVDWFGLIFEYRSTLTIAGVFTLMYLIGLAIDRGSDGRFARGFPPFLAPVGLQLWRIMTLTGGIAMAETLPFAFLIGEEGRGLAVAVIATAGGVTVWLVTMFIVGVLLDVSTDGRFSDGHAPFHFRLIRRWVLRLTGRSVEAAAL